MTKNYYEDVEFPELDPPKEDPKPKPDFDFTKLDLDWSVVMTEVRRLITAVETGQSNITPYGINLAKAPVVKAVQTLENDPSLENLVNFLDLGKQDVGARFRKECVAIFKQSAKLEKIMKEKNIE